MQFFNTTILPLKVLPLSVRRGYLLLFAITVILFYFTCSYICFYLRFYLSVVYWKIFLFRYLVSINFHVHIRAILDKWDYVSKTLFTIFKGSLRRRIPQWMRALSLYCPIYHIGVTPIYVLKLHLHFIDFWQPPEK